MPDTLYEDDILAWSEQQATLLRRAAAGERVNGLDWANVIEEIDSVGRSELHACRSLLRQALRHLLKCAAWPATQARSHWEGEVATFLAQAQDAFSPSMRQKIEPQSLYDDALYAVRRERVEGLPAAALAAACPFTLDELLRPHPDLDALIARLTAPEALPPR